MSTKKRVAFVSTMWTGPWGGSEELWSQTALDLVHKGYEVSASVCDVNNGMPRHERILKMFQAGINIDFRPLHHAIWTRAWCKYFVNGKAPTVVDFERFILAKDTSIVIFSAGAPLPPVEMLESCVSKGLPFVTIGQTNWEGWWTTDDISRRYRAVLPAALKCYFVSKENQRLTERQIAHQFQNAEVICNPFNVNFNASPPWPHLSDNDDLKLACVGRLHPPSKGQDILIEVLANSVWGGRKWRLTLYGEGPMREGLERMVQHLGLQHRVVFAGHVNAIEKIWSENHALVMPSRAEGMPLAMVEAMLCGRPVVATDVAGHSEIIEDGVTGFLADAPTVSSLAKALERLWFERKNIEEMGKAAARSIRRQVPADPIRVFSEKIENLAGTESMAI